MNKSKKMLDKCSKNSFICMIITALSFYGTAYAAVWMSQYILEAGIGNMNPLVLRLNVVCVAALFLLIYTVTLKTKVSLILGTLSIMILSTANYYTYLFRGSEMTPTDILALRTAMNVMGNYDFSFGKNILIPWGCFIVLVLAAILLPEYKWEKKWRPRVAAAVCLAVLMGFYLQSSEPYYSMSWENSGTKNNGYIFNFALQLQELYVEEPEGYSVKEVEKISESNPLHTNSKQKKPDIIVIMDESFSDLSVHGKELPTNQEVTPFINSLSENVVKGQMAVSSIGGGTCVSEYEALTGNSHLFLNNASSSYQQYVNQDVYSTVAEMKRLGYKCIGMHPYHASGWKREKVYQYLGFDEAYFLEDFPGEDFIRSYISDQEMFEMVVKKYEENKAANEQNLFLFGVSMQNHGGYTYEGDNFEYTITLEGYEKEYKDAEQYLSLIHETDKAVEYLIRYFEKEEREVIIVFFGDHHPSLSEEFISEISDVDYDTAEERLRYYTVPFFIWGNYDIQERTVDMIGLNYLMNEVYKTIGFELPPYQQFLSEIRKEIPFMNRYAYYSLEQDRFIHLDEAQGREKEILDLYWRVQYNNMFDHKHRNEVLFPLANE